MLRRHIVPAGERDERKGADTAQRIAYTCNMNPNEAVNGVWLRAFDLNRSPGIDTLDAEERTRPYHGSMRTPVYYAWLADQLAGFATSVGDCTSPNGIRTRLHAMRADIRDGQAPH